MLLVLNLQADDPDAKQTKLFLLLQTEQYDAALTLIDQTGKGSDHKFEQAYALYRLQNEVEARDALKAAKEEKEVLDRGAIHLEAQLVRILIFSMR